MKRRILATFLSLCLLVGLLPTVALATDEPQPETSVQSDATSDNTPELLSGSETTEAMSGDCGATESDTVTWKLEQNNEEAENPTYTLTISGTGNMRDYENPQTSGSTPAPWLNSQVQDGSNFSKITALVIENGITGIGDYAFSRMTGLTTLEVPGSVKEIGAYAFWGCNNLSSITLNEGLETIGESAFRTIYNMKEQTLNIPASVTTIAPYAFEIFQCKGYSVSAGSTSFKAIDGVLFSADGKTLVRYPTEKHVDTYQIPEGTEVIGVSAFELAPFSSVEFPSSVHTLEESAFSQCTKLTNVTLPDSIVTIGNGAFSLCNSLEKITVGSGVKTIGKNAFVTSFSGKDSRVVVDMTRADQIDSIGSGAFYHSTTQVANSAVYVANESIIDMFGFGSSGQTGQLYYSGTYIMCTNGGTIDIAGISADNSVTFLTPTREGFQFDGWYDNPEFSGTAYTQRQSSGQTQSKYYAKWNCEVTFDANGGNGTMASQTVTAGKPVALNAMSGMTWADGYAFTGWNTKADGSGQFYGDGALVTFDEPTTLYAQWSNAAAVIGTTEYDSLSAAINEARSGDTVVILQTSSDNITIPAGVTLSSGSVALSGTISGTDVTSVWVTSAAGSRYWVNNQWMTYVASGNCGLMKNNQYADTVTWDLYQTDDTNRFIRITGNGPMANGNNPGGNNPNNYAWKDYATTIKGAEICEGVTSIGSYSFFKTGIETITVADSVTTLGTGAFSNSAIRYFKAGKNVTTIAGSNLFNGSSQILAVDLTQATGIDSYPTVTFWDTTASKHVLYLADRKQLDKFSTSSSGGNNTIYSSWMIALAGEGAVVAEPAADAGNGYTTNVSHNGNSLIGWYKPDGTAATGFSSIQNYGGRENGNDNDFSPKKLWKQVYYGVYASTITFDANGGTGSPESVTSYYAPGLADGAKLTISNKTCTLPQNGYTREGYTFAGWNTEADGTGTAFTAGASVPISNEQITKLYAQWTKKIGGNESNYTVNAIVDQVYTGVEIKPAVVVKNGDTVLDSGYTVTYSNNTNIGTATATVAIGADTAEVTFRITKDVKPSVSMADVSTTYGTDYTMTATAMTSAGNEIANGSITIAYYTDEDCTTAWTPANNETQPTEAGTYYAKATLAGTENYAEASKIAKIEISKATFSVTAEGYSGAYDGQAHSITVEAEGAQVTYSETEAGTYSETKPSYSNAGTYTVYYKATKANHNDVTGSVSVEINKATLKATYAGEAIQYGQSPSLTVSVDGFVNGESASTAAGYEAPTVTAGSTNVGQYTLTPTGGEADNYRFDYVAGVLTISSAKYPVSVSTNTPTLTGSGTVTLTVTAAEGIQVSGVSCNDPSIQITDNKDGTYSAALPNTTKTYTFTVNVVGDMNNYEGGPATCTVSVTRYTSSGGSSSGGSSSSNVSGSGDDVSISPSGGSVTASQMESAVNKADAGAAITIKATSSSNISLPASGLESAADNDNSLILDLRYGEVTLSPEALSSVANQAGSTVTLTVTPVDTDELNSRQQAAVGDAPVFDLTIRSGSTVISDFDGGLVTVSIPYELPSNQDPAGVVVWFMDDNGNITPCETMYDTRTETVIFTTRHFSKYVIGYEEPTVFTDVSKDAYYADAVLWAVANGVTNGTSATTFSPDMAVSRAQMVTFLWRAHGSPKATGTNPFTDVSTGDYYYDAVLWAVANGVTNGTSATTFSPDAPVTRAQAVTFQWRAAGSPVVSGSSFGDVAADAYYVNAVTWAVANGITNGTSGTTFSPDVVVSRAQAVTFLWRELA